MSYFAGNYDIAVLLIWLSQRNENSTDHAE